MSLELLKVKLIRLDEDVLEALESRPGTMWTRGKKSQRIRELMEAELSMQEMKEIYSKRAARLGGR